MSVQVRSLSHRRRIASGPWTPASPTTTGGFTPVHWYRSDGPLWQDAGTTPATGDGDVVGRWEDLTANADHVNQNTAANKPTLQNAAGDLLNGNPVIRFDGSNDYLQGAFTNGGALTQPNTYFLVAKLLTGEDDDAQHYLVASDDPTNRSDLAKDNIEQPNVWLIHSGTVLKTTAANTDWHIWTVLFDGANSQLWHDGVSLGSGNTNANAPDGLTLGAYNNTSLAANCEITELLIYNADLGTADQNLVGRYLATRYGLAYTDI